MEKLSKTEAQKKIREFFLNIKNKNPKQVKKIKKLAMRYNIKLGFLKKKFCKRCLAFYVNPKIRIKNKIKTITCENCGCSSRWKIK